MTTLNPIELEKESLECVALIDLENIRLSWQRHYGRVFEYADLVLLCQLSERLMNTTMSRITIFATNPEDYESQAIKTTAVQNGMLPAGCSLNSSEVRLAGQELKRRNIPLVNAEDVAAGFRLIDRIRLDAERSRTATSISSSRSASPNLASSNPVAGRAPKRRRISPTPPEARYIGSRSRPIDLESEEAAGYTNSSSSFSETRPQPADLLSEMSELSDHCSEVQSVSDSSSCCAVEERGLIDALDDDDDDLVVLQSTHEPTTGPRRGTSGEIDEDDEVVIIGESKELTSCQKQVSPASPLQSTEPTMTLAGDGKDRIVQLRLYGFKFQKGRVVQRGCDVALGAEITKACFHPNIDKIVLFSADSDFQELMEENIKAENIGGVLKFAKTSWIFGFRNAFAAEQLNGLKSRHSGGFFAQGETWEGRQRKRQSPYGQRGIFQKDNITYVVLDMQFPQIKQYLHSRAAHRRPWSQSQPFRRLPRPVPRRQSPPILPMPPPPPPSH
eukprot:Blabericola_migrator_1__1781@NODE_1482_length_4453_cov_34_852941_g972_i0_p2_GENE_NODE_1482_length_4453_cov_34_852941_g972_i0NODE_1482_length_4453_cov_34_852941_g972_i0_p2_ORF_typecomplete_len502_score56_51NYN/PF01936_18/4_2e02NYN/PF01936_18/8_6e08_NODE_1482_length_4453_cov_34_852941_g972_i026764181